MGLTLPCISPNMYVAWPKWFSYVAVMRSSAFARECNGVYVLLRPGIRNKELAGSDAAHIGTAIDFMCVSNGNRE